MTDKKNAPDADGNQLEGYIENTPEHNNPPAWTTEDLPNYGEPFEGTDLPEDLDADPFADLDPQPPAGETKPETLEALKHWREFYEFDRPFKLRLPARGPKSQSAEELALVPEPIPLLPEVDKAAPYPAEALPPIMRDAVLAIAEHVQAPLALAGQCVIGAAAHLAQSRVNAPHMHLSEGMPPSVFLLSLAESGERKTAARRHAFKTIDESEAAARTDHRKACDDITSMADGLSGKQREKFLAEHPLPVDPRSQYSDATFERIAGDMIRGASAATWDTDEGAQLLCGSSLKADTRASTLGGLTKAFDIGSFERTRSHGNLEGSGFAYNRRIGIHLLAQPVTVAAALNDPLLQGQGFLARFLLVSPTSLAGTRFLTAEQLGRKSYEDPRLQRYWKRCRDIAASPQAIDLATGEVRPPVLALTAEAESEWLALYNEVEGEQSALGQFAGLRPFAGRAGELARRLAAVLAFFEGQAGIDGECMRRAAVLVRYSLGEWLRYTDGQAINPELQRAAELMQWLRAPKRTAKWQEFHANDLGKSGPPALRSARVRDRVLAILVERYHLLTSDGKQFVINPLAESADSAETQQPRGFSVADDLRMTAEKVRKAPMDSTASAELPQTSAELPHAETQQPRGLPQNPQLPQQSAPATLGGDA